MKKITKFTIIFSLIAFITFDPTLSFAQSGLIPCGTEKTKIETIIDANGKETQTGGEIINPCEFSDIFKLINDVVNFLLFTLALPIAAIMFAYSGFLMLFSGGDSGKRTKAKGIFWNVVLGLILAAAAWLIVHTILIIVGYKTGGGWDWFGF